MDTDKSRNVPRQASFKEDPRVTEKAKDPKFFWSEPGVGVIVVGALLEPANFKSLLVWALSLGGGIWLSAFKGKILKGVSLALVLSALRPFGEGRYLRFMFGMATVMRVLRVLEILISPEFFEQRGPMYTTKFCFLFHDLRRASCYSSKQEQEEGENKAVSDIAKNCLGIAASAFVLKSPVVLKSRFLIAVASMFRFYHFISLVEAGYRFHLAKFGIAAPVCFDNPWASETIAEFWGKRWNMVIATQLRNIFFRPVVQYTGNKTYGEMCIFLASSALHMIPVVTLGGSASAIGTTALFFVLQPGLMAFESKFKIKSRAWVQTALWSLAPLFSIPLYEVI